MLLKILKNIFYNCYVIYKFARRFILNYEGFSYSFEKNGEKHLLDALSGININTIFDIGANVGDWTEFVIKKFNEAKIHSFEISKTSFSVLQKKYQNNNQVFINNFGLSNKKGLLQYKDYGKNSQINSIITEGNFHDQKITPILVNTLVETGDNYCKKNDIKEIDLLKIDVEGAEHLVLDGFSNLLANGAIKIIQFEYGYLNADSKFLMKDFYRLFDKYGYVLGPLKPNGVIFMDFSYGLNNFNSGPNYVAVHKSCNTIIEKVKGKSIKGFPSI